MFSLEIVSPTVLHIPVMSLSLSLKADNLYHLMCIALALYHMIYAKAHWLKWVKFITKRGSCISFNGITIQQAITVVSIIVLNQYLYVLRLSLQSLNNLFVSQLPMNYPSLLDEDCYKLLSFLKERESWGRFTYLLIFTYLFTLLI